MKNTCSRIVSASNFAGHGLRLIGTTDIDGQGTHHEIADVDPIVLFDYGTFNTGRPMPFRPHPHLGLTAMSFLPTRGTWMAWDSLNGDSGEELRPGGLYYVHAGSSAFHYEYPSPETAAAAMNVEFVQLVWNATDESGIETVIVQPGDIPEVESDNACIRVLAGQFCGMKSVEPFSHRKIIFSYIQIKPGKTLEFEVPSSMNGILFPMQGDLQVNTHQVPEHKLLILGTEDRQLSVSALEVDQSCRFLLAAGEPLNKSFCKLLGLGGFIIGDTEAQVRTHMDRLKKEAARVRQAVPHYFPDPEV